MYEGTESTFENVNVTELESKIYTYLYIIIVWGHEIYLSLLSLSYLGVVVRGNSP